MTEAGKRTRPQSRLARSRDLIRRRAVPGKVAAARAPWISPPVAVVVVVVILAAVNVIDVNVEHAALAVGPACAALLLAIARGAGLSWRELGLGPGTWRRGFTAVIPVLTDGAKMPDKSHLPETMRPLSDRNAFVLATVRSGTWSGRWCGRARRGCAIA